MDQPRIPEELFQDVRDKGHVRVLVKIARDEAAGESIADAQTAVLAILAGTDYKRRYSSPPCRGCLCRADYSLPSPPVTGGPRSRTVRTTVSR